MWQSYSEAIKKIRGSSLYFVLVHMVLHGKCIKARGYIFSAKIIFYVFQYFVSTPEFNDAVNIFQRIEHKTLFVAC